VDDGKVSRKRSGYVVVTDKKPLQGEKVKLLTPEPWDEEVDGQQLLKKLVAVFKRYLVMPEGAAEAMALWVLFTHCFEAAQIAPRLAFTSALPRSGKTTALDIISFLVPKAKMSSGLTASYIFRIIDQFCPTLLIDEADTFLEGDNIMRGILNSGHKKSGAYVGRTVGDDHEPRDFSTWCPMALAKIGAFPDTLAERSIIIRMQRKQPGDRVRNFTWGKAPGLRNLAKMAARWAVDNLKELKRAKPERPDGLFNDRAVDNWRLMLAIADQIGGEWPVLARKTAVLLSVDEDDAAVQTEQGVVALVGDRWLAKGGAYTEHELRERFSTVLPPGRIGGIITRLVEDGVLRVDGKSRAPHRLLLPGDST